VAHPVRAESLALVGRLDRTGDALANYVAALLDQWSDSSVSCASPRTARVHADTLLAEWQPDGAIWFAQACCSAGSDSPTAYAGLFEVGSLLDETLSGTTNVGAR
jgi:hypothetical protein